MFSLELPENVTKIESYAFYLIFCLQNVAIPPNADLADDFFINQELDRKLEGKYDQFQRSYKKRHWTDLQQLFGDSWALGGSVSSLTPLRYVR